MFRGRGGKTALAIRIRIEIREGRFAAAVESLQTGYAMGRHMADAPFLINSLVGIAICQMMNERVIELSQAKGGPNLYWSLTALPRPLVDMRRSMEFEAASTLMVFPELLSAETVGGSESAAQFKKFVDRFENLAMSSTGTQGPEYELRNRLMKTLKDEDAMAKVRSFLVKEAGYKEAAVKKMAATQVLLLRERAQYERLRDDLFKWSFLPYHEAEAGFAAWNAAYEKAKKANEALPMVSLLLPGIDRASQVQARLDRGVNLLRIVEAIRQYAATHDDQLPKSLNDLSLPISINPVNGKPFEYARDGDAANDRRNEGPAAVSAESDFSRGAAVAHSLGREPEDRRVFVEQAAPRLGSLGCSVTSGLRPRLCAAAAPRLFRNQLTSDFEVKRATVNEEVVCAASLLRNSGCEAVETAAAEIRVSYRARSSSFREPLELGVLRNGCQFGRARLLPSRCGVRCCCSCGSAGASPSRKTAQPEIPERTP